MKKIFPLLLMISAILYSCKEEENPAAFSKPQVTTNQASNIGPYSATVSGEIISDGGQPVTRKGFYYADHPDPTAADSILVLRTEQFSGEFSGLKKNTTYYVKAFATNSAGTTSGNDIFFTTLPSGVAQILTTGIMNIGSNCAVVSGNVINDGGQTVTEKGVCWSLTSYPTTEGKHKKMGQGLGSFSVGITGLAPRTTYFVRAYAINSEGTAYGIEQSFMTMDSVSGHPCPGLPTISYNGKTYSTVQIGEACWLAENLNVGKRIPGTADMKPANDTIEKYCFNDAESNCDVYGALYQWDEMMQGTNTGTPARGICPPGWHIPQKSEWDDAIIASGGVEQAGLAMKANTLWLLNGNGTNASGFNGVPTGLRYYNGDFAYQGIYGYFWCNQSYGNDQAYYFVLNYANSKVPGSYDKRNLGFSVRCIRDN